VLADLGIIEPARVGVAWEQYLQTGDLSLKIPLFLTIHVELWLRARLRSGADRESGAHSDNLSLDSNAPMRLLGRTSNEPIAT
jgi:hypothetical protein